MSIFIKGLNRLIKDMKMPKLEKTYKVRLYKAVDGRIIVTACGIKDNLLRPVGEAIEVPTSHGRLIDADKIDYRNDAMHDGTGHLVVADNFINGVLWINDCIDNAPTVIEAEEET